jgi:polyhydroxyalkanoate synthase
VSDPLAGLNEPLLEIDGLSQLERVRRGMFVHTSTPRPPIGQTPNVVVHRQDKLLLRYYAPSTRRHETPVVLVPSLINKASILDLEEDRSLVKALSEAGHPVYLVDWGVPGAEDADEDVGYVLEQLLQRSMKRAMRHARSSKAHLFGYCMGGTLAAMYAALHPEQLASLVLLNAPFRFSDAGRFHDFVSGLDLDATLAEGLVPVEVMQPAFKLLDPMGNWSKYLGIEAASRDPRKLVRTLARERWLEENVPVSGAFAREFIGRAYQDDALLAGTWEIRGRRVDLGAITCPTLVVACERDFIAPSQAVLPVLEAIPNARAEVLPIGHIGVVVGGFGPKVFYPMLDAWFTSPNTSEGAA